MKLQGFSLVELLVVIAIISILMGAAFAILRPQDYIKRSRDSRRQSDLKVVQTALEQYYSNTNDYPATGAVPFGSPWTVGATTYLRQTPQDPNGATPYCYVYTSPNYEVCATLEMSSGTAPWSGTCAGANYCLGNPF